MTIEIYGHYYYRDENHIPRRITIIEKGTGAGFYWCLDGHLTKEECQKKQGERFLIHQNRITI